MDNDKMASDQKEPEKIKNIINIKKYKDPTGLSAENLDFGLWISKYKRLIISITISALALLGAFFIIYALYGYFMYFTIGQEQDKILNQTDSSVDLAQYRATNEAKPLQIENVKALNGREVYDLTAKIKNPNSKHYAAINYCFTIGEDKKCSSTFILPSEEKIIILAKQKVVGDVSDLSLKVETVNWQKLNARYIPNWEIYKKERLNFTVTEPKSATYGTNLNYLEFTISNDSAYSFYEVPLNIIARNSDNIIAVNRYVVTDFKSREKKNIRLSWPEVTTFGGTIDVIPDLNIISDSVYKPYSNY